MVLLKLLQSIKSFDWDEGNTNKNWEKHKVATKEAEETFYNKPLLLFLDKIHSNKEKRFQILGKTNEDRKLFISFTLRNKKVRVISARNMSRKERRQYENI